MRAICLGVVRESVCVKEIYYKAFAARRNRVELGKCNAGQIRLACSKCDM